MGHTQAFQVDQFIYQLKWRRYRKVRTSISIPGGLLRPYCPISLPNGIFLHTIVYDPVLTALWTLCEARMADAMHFIGRILVEHTAGLILLPVGCIHGVFSYELKLA
jgi:hypothetical protein